MCIVRISADVRDMHDPAFERHPPDEAVATRRNGLLAQDRPILGFHCTERTRHMAVDLALAYRDSCGIGAAKPGGRLHYCVQHWLHIGGRPADDLQHIAGRGLVFERLFEVARAGLQFSEQPRILHRDDRLVGKGAHQFGLPLGERLDPMAVKCDDADWLALAQQRYPKYGASPGCQNLGHRVVRVSADVRDVHDPAFERHPASDGVATGDNGSLAQGRP